MRSASVPTPAQHRYLQSDNHFRQFPTNSPWTNWRPRRAWDENGSLPKSLISDSIQHHGHTTFDTMESDTAAPPWGVRASFPALRM